MITKLLSFLPMLVAVEEPKWIENVSGTIKEVVNFIVWPVITIVATVGVIYAIVLGVNYAKAESSEDRENAKKRIINVVVGALLMIVLMLALYLFAAYSKQIFAWVSGIGEGVAGARLFR